jgi:hypothetical protein
LLLLALRGTADNSRAGAESAAAVERDQVPAVNCPQPVPPPRVQPDPAQVARFGEQMNTYSHCVQDYVAQRNAIAHAHNLIEMQQVEASNAAIKAYNDFVLEAKTARPSDQ